MNFSERLTKLNVLEKLLKQDLISISKKLGDEKIVGEINDEIRKFLLANMEATFNGIKVNQDFTAQEAAVLKEMAKKLIERATNTVPMPSLADLNSMPSAPPTPPIRRQGSPILEALRAQGFDPKASLEERKAAVKAASKASSGK